MKTIEVTNHQKTILELCVRLVLCELLEEEQDVIDEFTAGLFNLVKGNFGDQELEEEVDPNNWIAQLDVLRSLIRKLETEEWAKLNEETGSKPYRLPKEDSKT
jgi:hypothetical protein